MFLLRRLTSVHLAALATIGLVAGVMMAYGNGMFSPGSLSAQARPKVSLGGVSSHAEIKACASCHVPAWGKETMADRCMNCHADVRLQLENRGPLHGKVPQGEKCRSCHSEHHGPKAPLTHLARFDHDWTGFKLTGKHTQSDCQSCHVNNVYKGTPHLCVSCHKEPPVPKVHRSHYGTSCAQCHSTSTWAHAAFEHKKFSINHGRRQNTCATCHTDMSQPKKYTCYNCHEHRPQKIERIHARRNIESLQNCVDCHGRRGRDRRRVSLDGALRIE
jgi:hypothetical protein